jgi:hypothetical protein
VLALRLQVLRQCDGNVSPVGNSPTEQNPKGTSGVFQKGPVISERGQYPQSAKEHIANREQIVYIASIAAMKGTSRVCLGMLPAVRCEPVESRP